jgi:hypothetical protein
MQEVWPKWTTLIQSSTTQGYFDSKCAFTCMLHVSACTRFFIDMSKVEYCVLYRALRRADRSSGEVLPSVYVSLSAIKSNINSVHLKWVGKRGRHKKERRKKWNIFRHVDSNLITVFYHDRMKPVQQILTYVSDTKPDITPIPCSGFPEHLLPWLFPNQILRIFCIFSNALHVNCPSYIKQTIPYM